MLHNVDKDSVDRGNPGPNGHDRPQDVVTSAMNFSHSTGSAALLRVVYSGTANLPRVSLPMPTSFFSGDTATTTVYTHNLGYIPAVLGYLVINNQYILMPYSNTDSTAGGSQVLWYQYSISADEKYVYLTTTGVAFNAAFLIPGLGVQFYLLQQAAVVDVPMLTSDDITTSENVSVAII